MKNHAARLARLARLLGQQEYCNLVIGQPAPGQRFNPARPVIWLPMKEEVKNG